LTPYLDHHFRDDVTIACARLSSFGRGERSIVAAATQQTHDTGDGNNNCNSLLRKKKTKSAPFFSLFLAKDTARL
jgi:hypothetical protein